MAAFVLTNKAVEDLSEIWSYTREAWSEHQAETYYHMLLDTCRELAEGKVAGNVYPEIQLNVSGFSIGQHIVFYRGIDQEKLRLSGSCMQGWI